MTFNDLPLRTLDRPKIRRRAVLSIFSWERGDTHVRTLCEYNLPALAFPAGGFSNDQEWLREWQAAFDVEMVTQKFFAEYQRIFAEVEAAQSKAFQTTKKSNVGCIHNVSSTG